LLLTAPTIKTAARLNRQFGALLPALCIEIQAVVEKPRGDAPEPSMPIV
jgi:hypothetical protein